MRLALPFLTVAAILALNFGDFSKNAERRPV